MSDGNKMYATPIAKGYVYFANRYNGEDIKFKNYVAKDTTKEKYCRHCKLD